MTFLWLEELAHKITGTAECNGRDTALKCCETKTVLVCRLVWGTFGRLDSWINIPPATGRDVVGHFSMSAQSYGLYESSLRTSKVLCC